MKKNDSTFYLVLSNLIPLFGVLFFAWSIFSVIFIYWCENIVVGFYNILRMWKAEKPVVAADKVKINGRAFTGTPSRFLILFFMVHFGIFTFVHGVFVFTLFFDGVINVMGILLSVLGLFISHGISYQQNFIGREEYKKISRIEQMFKPYSRIVVLQLVIIFSGFFVMSLGLDIGAIILLVLIKIVVDVLKHKQEHRRIVS